MTKHLSRLSQPRKNVHVQKMSPEQGRKARMLLTALAVAAAVAAAVANAASA